MNYFTNLTNRQKGLMLLGILIILLGHAVDEPIDEDKKAFSFRSSKLLATTGGLGLFFAQLVSKGGLLSGPTGWIIIGVSSLLFLAPSIINKWADLFSPQPTIPGFVWIGAFMVIIFLILSKKSGGR